MPVVSVTERFEKLGQGHYQQDEQTGSKGLRRGRSRLDKFDLAARAVEKHQAETQEDFLSIAEERNMDIDSFCNALISSKDPWLIALRSQIMKEQHVSR